MRQMRQMKIKSVIAVSLLWAGIGSSSLAITWDEYLSAIDVGDAYSGEIRVWINGELVIISRANINTTEAPTTDNNVISTSDRYSTVIINDVDDEKPTKNASMGDKGIYKGSGTPTAFAFTMDNVVEEEVLVEDTINTTVVSDRARATDTSTSTTYSDPVYSASFTAS